MKIERYHVVSSPDLVPYIAEGMGLFSIPQDDTPPDLETMPSGTVLVRCTASGLTDGRCLILTELYFRHQDGKIGCMMRCNDIDPQAKQFPAKVSRVIRMNLLAMMTRLTGKKPGPWGILRGVRPTKIIHKMLDQGIALPAIRDELIREYALDDGKAALLVDVAARQRAFLLSPRHSAHSVSVYIGIPYCPSRCLYCSFPAGKMPGKEQVDQFLQALYCDIDAAKKSIDDYQLSVESVYVGGGTPTCLSSDDFSALLDKIGMALIGSATREFTVEAGRPDSISPEKITAMAKNSVTRTSINPQSMQQKTLDVIGRPHTVQAVAATYHLMKQAGIPVINMDLIAGLPGEDENDMINTMEQISALQPDNLTIHTLARKRGSVLYSQPDKYSLPDAATVANMVAVASRHARKMGLHPYYLYRQKNMTGNLENVGYARRGTECLYNIQIIEERQTIIGIGPAAGTKAVHVGTWRLQSCYQPKDINTYCHHLHQYLEKRSKLISGLFTEE